MERAAPHVTCQKPLVSGGLFAINTTVKASEFFALPPSLASFAPFFAADAAPWDWIKRIGAALEAAKFGPLEIKVPAGVHIEGKVWLHPSVKLPPHATIIGPVWIGAKTKGIRSEVAGEIPPRPLTTLETAATETPASAATSLMVARPGLAGAVVARPVDGSGAGFMGGSSLVGTSQVYRLTCRCIV